MKKLVLITALALCAGLHAAPPANPQKTKIVIVDRAPPRFTKATFWAWVRWYL
jgi:hypothetical protein